MIPKRFEALAAELAVRGKTVLALKSQQGGGGFRAERAVRRAAVEAGGVQQRLQALYLRQT